MLCVSLIDMRKHILAQNTHFCMIILTLQFKGALPQTSSIRMRLIRQDDGKDQNDNISPSYRAVEIPNAVKVQGESPSPD